MADTNVLKVIPGGSDPWVAVINGKKYVYPAGTEQYVPAEVAVLIDAYWNKQEVDYPETGISFNDLRDRPFGESAVVLLDQTIDFAQENPEADPGTYMVNEAWPINAGDTVVVTWDGVPYECVATAHLMGVVFGDFSGMFGGESTGEPFVGMVSSAQQLSAIMAKDQTVHSVKVEAMEIKTLDPKFIPAGVGGGVVIVQDSAAASGVAAVDTVAPTATMNAVQIAESVKAGKTVYFLMVDMDSVLFPLTGIYRYLDLVSETMAAAALPDPYVLFGYANEDGMYRGVKVFLDGSYNVFEYVIETPK